MIGLGLGGVGGEFYPASAPPFALRATIWRVGAIFSHETPARGVFDPAAVVAVVAETED